MAKGISVLAVLLLLTLSVGAARGIVIDRVVAKVNDEVITLSEVQEKGMPLLSKVRGSRSENGREVQEAEKEVLNRLIDMKLQLQDARSLGLTIAEKIVDEAVENIKKKNNITQEALERMLVEAGTGIEAYRNEIRDQYLLQRVYYFRVITSAKVNAADIKAYYTEHISEYTSPGKVNVFQIFFTVDPGNPTKREDVVRARAMEVIGRISAGEDFATMAKAYSEGPNASLGGDLGFFKRGEILPVLEEAMFSLESGQVSDLIRSKAGFHILKVKEHIYPAPLPIEKVKKDIISIIKKEKAEDNYGKWIKELRQKAFIEITYDL